MLSEEQLLLSQLAKLFSLLPQPKVQLVKHDHAPIVSLYEKNLACFSRNSTPKVPFSSPLQLLFQPPTVFFKIEIHLILTQDYRFWPDLTCRAHTIARNNLRQGFLKGVVLLGVFSSRKSCWGSNIAANEEGLLDSFQGLILWCFLRPSQLLWHCETTNTPQVYGFIFLKAQGITKNAIQRGMSHSSHVNEVRIWIVSYHSQV